MTANTVGDQPSKLQGEYRETVWGLAPQPITVVGTLQADMAVFPSSYVAPAETSTPTPTATTTTATPTPTPTATATATATTAVNETPTPTPTGGPPNPSSLYLPVVIRP